MPAGDRLARISKWLCPCSAFMGLTLFMARRRRRSVGVARNGWMHCPMNLGPAGPPWPLFRSIYLTTVRSGFALAFSLIRHCSVDDSMAAGMNVSKRGGHGNYSGRLRLIGPRAGLSRSE